MAKDISKAKSYRRTKVFADIILSAAVVTACVYITKGIVDRSEYVAANPFVDNTELENAKLEADKADPTKTVFENITFKTEDINKGSLILVNEDHQYFSGNEDLVGIIEMNEQTGRDFFTAVAYDYTIERSVYEPMAQMIEDFYNKYDKSTLVIYGSYRTTDFQRELYEADLAATGSEDSTRVAKPGFSEHESGYAFDFTETESNDYQGTGDYAWINENCYKYGFIERYKEDKSDITKIQAEPWHFRYVGMGHAYFMVKNNLCFEEYIDKLKNYTYDGERLEFTDEDGMGYEIYYVPADMTADKTEVPVPSGKMYDVSGNNVDGFIVTIYKNGKEYLNVPMHREAEEPVTESETSAEENSEEEVAE